MSKLQIKDLAHNQDSGNIGIATQRIKQNFYDDLDELNREAGNIGASRLLSETGRGKTKRDTTKV